MRGIGIVKTSYGYVSGEEKNGITVFRSVPYAAPPVGDLRWRAPREHEPWDGVRECTEFGNIAWQLPGMVGADALEMYPQNEDCLLLNIWTPAQHADEKFPVLFWIHGGGFAGGVGHEAVYDGATLASKGIIVVSLNYRLNIFGFLAHPDLRKEADGNGNFGLLDIIFALKWVRKNIAAFGGDPTRVTVDGQSAGGMAVGCLLASPLTHGLLAGGIIQSGGPRKGRGNSLEESEKTGLEVAEMLHCNSIEEMRKIDPAVLCEISGKVKGMRFSPCVDGAVLPMIPYDAFMQGKIAQVPIMIGSNSHEGMSAPIFNSPFLSREEYLKGIKEYCKDRFSELEGLYDLDAKNISVLIGGDLDFLNIRKTFSAMQKVHTAPLYHYYFSKPLVLKDGTNLGAGHSGENFYVFNTLHRIGKSTLDGREFEVDRRAEDYFLSDNISWYWSSFVKNGTPNKVGLEEWKPVSENGAFMHFDGAAGQLEYELHPEQTGFWTEILDREE